MKNITIIVIFLSINSSNMYSQFYASTGFSLGSFYENKYKSETRKKLLISAGFGFDHQLFKSNIGITSRLMYTQLGGKLDDINEYYTNYSAECYTASLGMKFINNFHTKMVFSVSVSPSILYVRRLNARLNFKNSDRIPLNLSLDPDHPNTQRWNYGINSETGIEFKIKQRKIGASIFYTQYLEDMGGGRRYAYGGGYENNKFYFENKGLRLSYFF